MPNRITQIGHEIYELCKISPEDYREIEMDKLIASLQKGSWHSYKAENVAKVLMKLAAINEQKNVENYAQIQKLLEEAIEIYDKSRIDNPLLASKD